MTTQITRLALLSTASAAAAAFALPGAASAQQTNCTLQAGSTTIYECSTDTTSTATITVTSGTFNSSVPLSVSSNSGNISVTAIPVAGGIILNQTGVAGQNTLTLTNTFAGGGITLNAAGQTFQSNGADQDVISFSSNGGPVTLTTGNLIASGDNSIAVSGTGASTANITVGEVSTINGPLAQAANIQTSGDLSFTSQQIASGGSGVTLLSSGGAVSLNSQAITAGIVGPGTAVDLTGSTGVTFTGNGVISTRGDGVVATTTTGPIIIRSGAVQAAGDAIVTVNTTGTTDIGNCPTVSTTGAGATGIMATSTTGAITINCGAVTTAGAGSDGVMVMSDTGAVSVTTASVNTGNFADSDGVVIDTDGAITTNTGNITTQGDDSVGLLITGGAGNVQAGFGNITTAGTGASYPVLISTTTGNINLAGGNVTATGANQIGIELTSDSGAITGTTGTITATGAASRGLVVNGAGGGAVNLTTGAVLSAQDAIVIDNGADAITLNAGNVRTTEADAPVVTLRSTGPISLTAGTVTGGAAGSDGVIIVGGSGAINSNVGAVTVTGLDSDGISISGTGTINSTSGVITTNGNNSNALMIMGGAGPITATVAGATTTGTGSEAVLITGTGPVTFTNQGQITTNGSRGVAISGVTTANVACGNISTTGAGATAFDLSANGNTTVTCGTIVTTGAGADGINVVNASGTTTVTGTNTTVSGQGSMGIDVATAGTGAVTVNTGTVTSTAAAPAVANPSMAAVRVIASGEAPVVVNATGNVSATTGSAIWAQSAGTATVNVNSGVTVSGPTAVTLGGTLGNTLVVNGTIQSTTAGAPAYMVMGAPLNLTLGATGNIVGPLVFTAGADTFTNNRTAGLTQSGVLDFGAGNDIFNNNTSFTQNAAVNFGDGNDVVNNAGIYTALGTTDFGAGTDVFNNLATGQVRVFGGAATFANLETFNNTAGLIDLRDGAANDTFTISGAYAATGAARLGLDVIGTNTGLTADRLIIGGATTGTTTILPTFGGVTVIDPIGALVVDSTGNNIGANNFVLGGVTNDTGFVNYGLVNRAGDVFLVATPDAALFDQLFVNRVANDIWYQSAEAYQAYAMSRRVDYGNDRKHPLGIWAQLYGSRDRFGDRDVGVTAFSTNLTTSNRMETNRRGAQVGLDFGMQNFLVGVTAGYERAEGDSDLGSELVAEGYNYGAYAQFGAQQGLYAGLLLKRDDFDVRVLNSAVATLVTPDGRSTGADGEVGFRFGNPGGINFDVGAGLSYVRTNVDDYMLGGIAFDSDRHTSTRGRLQARATFAGTLAPFIDAKVFREFGDESELTIRSGALSETVADGKRGTWGRLEGGLGGGVGGGPLLSAWIDVGDVKGWGVRGGFRF